VRIDDEGRDCLGCNKFKVWDDFYKGKSAHGRESRCKLCRKNDRDTQPAEVRERRRKRDAAYQRGRYGQEALRRATFKHLYGITPEQYDQLLEDQGGVCALHGGPETMLVNGRPRRLIIEHAHDCSCKHACPSCIRGLTCHQCNRIIAMVERLGSAGLAARFSDYLPRRPLLVTPIPGVWTKMKLCASAATGANWPIC
jgi:hypothetical protein